MELTFRELWTALHGMALGAAYLLAFSGGFAALWALRGDWLTLEGAGKLLRISTLGSWAMAILSWVTVLLGTYMIYPWYRAKAPASRLVHAAMDMIIPWFRSKTLLTDYPKYLLLSKPQTYEWHEFGMEWKEHIAWFAPILATAVAFVVARHGKQLLGQSKLRRALLVLFAASFFCAAVAGVFGAMINKAAPTR